ncbi:MULTISPECIES: hypothetical protein [unclassified Nonomuraea]|uniref:hypothetical protein n=1 Tax=unclassified Nonomuraea TaxID=2593643 RepID=UPI0033E42DDB
MRFVLVERQGTSSLYRINENAPTSADVVMGSPAAAAPTYVTVTATTGLGRR